MATEIHFVDVGQGNMVLIKADDGTLFVFDCNITQENQSTVLAYVGKVFGRNKSIIFICSHRDADHMRGIKKLHDQNPISKIWDSNYPGTTTNSSEYKEYMALRQSVGSFVIEKKMVGNYGKTRLIFMSAADKRLPADANGQGIVIKVEQRSQNGERCLASAMLPADSDAEIWRDAILNDYTKSDVKSSILMAAHHGSNSFFEIAGVNGNYTAHLEAIAPQMVILSVGLNTHGHPNREAIAFYERYATSTDYRDRIRRTDKNGTMKLTLKSEGDWSLQVNQ